ncbi:MAG: peptidoglycan-associated lipoprotein Pal [candidate division Zixibacteria bacterium]|nr:peptidoglycan-associated lipoprotein Pal [candidate division Zixibacteria bacterium]
MKKLLALLLSLSLLAMFAGCGKKPVVEPETRPLEETTTPTDETTPTTPPGGEEVEVEKDIGFVTVYFDFDKYNLRDDARRGLQTNVQLMKANPDLTVLIEGHCDERGTVEYNLALGEKRARSTRDYMVSLGINPDRISIISYGKERPVDLGHNEIAWAKNRRAEFVTE